MTRPRPRHPAHEPPPPKPVLRWLANTMSLYGLCARAACRRAWHCRGEPQDCLSRYAPLVPEEARDGVGVMVDALWRGQSCDDLLEEAEDELAALGDWIMLVEDTRGRRF